MSIRSAFMAGSSLAAVSLFVAAEQNAHAPVKVQSARHSATDFRSASQVGKIPVEYLRQRLRLREVSFSVTKNRFAPSWRRPRTLNVQVLGREDAASMLAIARRSLHEREQRRKPRQPVIGSPHLASRGGRPPTATTKTPVRSGSQEPASTVVGGAPQTGTSIARMALSFVGYPYVYGAQGPNAFDCSGFAEYVYAKCGIAIPRTSFQQFDCGRSVSRAELEPGDLVFFSTTGAGPTHVAVYVGNGLMVQALNAQVGVVVSHLDAPYYAERYLGARRPWHA
ncbi:MAG: C40 family peptidase [Alicyclobacillus herbarius]|uniref:C40 family peptidase n=1 Tax=Alicyclobacillus herbarius TaxID=122960 RepID=UPI00042507B4|nr:C40 family peptidase [Alicyclobacillus herbarius]MCL6631285.1 C40 family peptidase [Alicyclobacillus herbarius]